MCMCMHQKYFNQVNEQLLVGAVSWPLVRGNYILVLQFGGKDLGRWSKLGVSRYSGVRILL